jgi:transposase
MGDPRQHQFEFCLWTLAVIRSLLKKTHGIELSKSSVSRLLGHLGLSPQRPIYRCYKQDPKKIEKYLKKTFPEIRKLAKDIGAEIYFVDEAAVRSDSHRGTTWGKVGQTPVVEDGGGRFGLKLISAVSPRGDMRFSFVEGRMNSERFVSFLKKLRADAGRPIIVIADNASYHISGKVKSFASDAENGVWLENLPAYAPELNPDEQVWNHAKRRLAKLFIATKAQMKAELTNIMRSIQKTTKLLKSFFRMKDTKYASAIE